jgi:hyperosmotically inducible periplasmic protein
MKQLLVVILMALVSLQVSCTRNEPSTTEAAREPAARMMDSDLEQRIQSKFNADAQLNAARLSVDADVDNNRVTLSGDVESEAMRTRATEMAQAAQPGVVIENKIDVKPRELSRSEYTEEHARTERERARTSKDNVGSSIDDAWIHAKVVTKLIGDSDTPERTINVDVNNNRVTLRGTVETAAQKAEAERIARETEGVKGVVNQLRIAAR